MMLLIHYLQPASSFMTSSYSATPLPATVTLPNSLQLHLSYRCLPRSGRYFSYSQYLDLVIDACDRALSEYTVCPKTK